MENRQVVLFVEEAQGMPLETLEEIRLLSNLETDEHKLLQIILFGQPELDENLAQQSIRQLRERITHNFELEPLTQNEIHSYLNFRMRQVGYTGPELISSGVAKKVEQHSAGLLRRINIIADKILLSAFAEGTHNLGPKHVSAAVNDSAFNQGAPRKSALRWWLLALAAFIILALGLYQTRAQWMAIAGVERLLAPAPAAQSASSPALDASDPGVSRQLPGSAAQSSTVAEDEPADSIVAAAVIAESGQRDDPGAQADSLTMPVAGEPAPPAQAAYQSEPEIIPVAEGMAGDLEEITPADTKAVPQADITAAEPAVMVVESASLRTLESSEAPVQLASIAAQIDDSVTASEAILGYDQWLTEKLELSRQWLASPERRELSIQVMTRKKTAARELVYYIRNEWPLDISQTYIYEVTIEGRPVYRVFYGEFESLKKARAQIEKFPDVLKLNSPYVHSVNRMRQALL
jgi:septal ring-binding cell division protein DamX